MSDAGAPGGNRRSRNRGTAGHGNHERWLLPYADMITLLLALFIMLYAIAQVNNAKLDALSLSVNKAFNGQKAVMSASAPSAPSALTEAQAKELLQSGTSVLDLREALHTQRERDRDLENLKKLQAKIQAYAKAKGFASQVQTTIDERGLVIRLLSDKVLFDTGSAKLRAELAPLISHVTALLRTVPNPVRVEGHTDSRPIATGQFPSNWELSVLRASSILRYMAARGLPERRVSAAGYAATHPVAPNSSAAGRQRNRRVEIVVLRRGNGRPLVQIVK